MLKPALTELRNTDTINIDLMDSAQIVSLINQEDMKVALAVQKVLPDVAKAVDYIAEAFDTLKEVSRLPEYVFNILRGGIRSVRKSAEGGGIRKVFVGKFSYIQFYFSARNNILGGFFYVP